MENFFLFVVTNWDAVLKVDPFRSDFKTFLSVSDPEARDAVQYIDLKDVKCFLRAKPKFQVGKLYRPFGHFYGEVKKRDLFPPYEAGFIFKDGSKVQTHFEFKSFYFKIPF